jgi:hypothetical protein
MKHNYKYSKRNNDIDMENYGYATKYDDYSEEAGNSLYSAKVDLDTYLSFLDNKDRW